MKKTIILTILCAIVQGTLAQNTYNYYKCSWDDENKQVVRTELTASGKIDDISSPKYASGGGLIGEDYDYFVATKSCTIRNGLTASGTCKLILLDGVTITVIGNGIEVLNGSSLNIYAQSYEGNNIGKLISRPENERNAAIGSKEPNPYNYYPGGIVINGGIVEAYGGEGAAGIGGGWKGNGGTVVIYDGNVTAQGGEEGAGIGGGYQGNGDHLIVYGGTVKATGGIFAAGIGSGRNFERSAKVYKGGTVEIYGGKVIANGGEYGAGIGGGQDAWGADVIVAGGRVETDGGMDAAGIGSGESVSSSIKAGSLKVTGGYVYADGTGWGAGIGGGEDAEGANVEITGGTVVAWAGSDAGEKNGSAIGSEDGDGHRGSLKIGDKMMVHAGQNPGDANGHLFSTGERVPACFFRPYCRVEVCNHEGHTYTINGTDANDTHTLRCPHCLDRTEEKHTFEGGKCSVCGAAGSAGSAFDVKVYLPKSGSGYDSPQTFNIAANKEFMLPSPPDENEPTGLAFAGWAKSETEPTTLNDCKPLEGETLLAAGAKITITNTTYLVARYNNVSISLKNDQDNSTILLNNDNKIASSVTLTGRTLFKDGTWNTLCLPFDVTIAGSPLDGDGVVVKTLGSSSYKNRTLTINFATQKTDKTITAGTPFLIKWTSGTNIENPEFTNVTINNNLQDTPTDYITFIGTFSPDGIYEEGAKTKLYLGSNNKLRYPKTEGYKVNSCRGYFQLKGAHLSNNITTEDLASAREFIINFGEDETTGITEVNANTARPASKEVWYTPDGRRLDRQPATKGIYINNGRKIVIP